MIGWALVGMAWALSGTVRENGTGIPIEGALLEPVGAEPVVTDAAGRFSLDLPAGTEVRVVAGGYNLTVVAIPTGEKWTIWLDLSPSELEIVVESRREKSSATEHRLDRERVLETPGTHEDPVRLVQSLPGVTVTPEYSKTAGDIAVRGAAPGENRFYLDGIELPYLYHYNQYSSVFHTRLLDELTLYPSTPGAAFGGVTGAIVDTRSTWTVPERVRGSVNLNTIMAGGELSIPLAERWSFRASGRRSYLDLAEKNDAWYTVFPIFWDYFGRIEFRPEPVALGLSVFGAGDRYTRLAFDPSLVDPYEAQAQHSLDWNHSFHVVALQHRSVTPQRWWMGSIGFTFHQQKGKVENEEESFQQYRITIREDMEQPIDEQTRIRAGLELLGETIDLLSTATQPWPGLEEETPFLARGIAANDRVTRMTGVAYLELKRSLGPLKLAPGLTLELDTDDLHTGGGIRVMPDPRLVTSLQASPSTQLRLAGGRYTAWAKSLYLTNVFGEQTLPPTTSWQVAGGVDQVVADRLEFTLDGYYKTLENLLDLDTDGTLLTGLSGYAYGAELSSRYRLKGTFFTSLSLALSHAVREDASGATAVYDYDQPFSLNAIASWTFRPTWTIGLRYRAASGLPYTPVIDGTYTANTDTYTPVYGDTNSARMTWYQKFDLHVEKRFNAHSWNLTAYGEFWYVPKPNNNMYVVYSYDFDETQPVHGPGFVPLLGLRGEF